MRFVCDHDVDAAVAAVLRRHGHEAWTVGLAGLSSASDDELTVYAHNKNAALITHDVEFSQRRRRNVVGQHIWLRCPEEDAAELIAAHIEQIVLMLSVNSDLWIKLSVAGTELSFRWE